MRAFFAATIRLPVAAFRAAGLIPLGADLDTLAAVAALHAEFAGIVTCAAVFVVVVGVDTKRVFLVTAVDAVRFAVTCLVVGFALAIDA